MRHKNFSAVGYLKTYTKAKLKKYASWPSWRLVFTCLFFLALGFVWLRLNNQEALRKYHAVLKADQLDGNVYEELAKLRDFTLTHMNSGLRQPVQLVYAYNKDAEQIIKASSSSLNADPNYYLDAQKECEAKGIPITARAQCVAEKVSSANPESGQPATNAKINLPDKALYSFKFNSPRFSLDWAGLSFLISFFFALIFIFRMLIARWVRKRWPSIEDAYL